jgi:hypothetical protein
MHVVHAHETSREPGALCAHNGVVEFPDRQTPPAAGPAKWHPESHLISSIIRVCHQCKREISGRKTRDYSLTTTPSGLWPTRSAWSMETRHDGFRVICASRRRWRLATTGIVSKLMIIDATRAGASNLRHVEGVA